MLIEYLKRLVYVKAYKGGSEHTLNPAISCSSYSLCKYYTAGTRRPKYTQHLSSVHDALDVVHNIDPGHLIVADELGDTVIAVVKFASQSRLVFCSR